MKSILIEKVVNGYLVRPFSPAPLWAESRCSEAHNVFVYRTIEEVAADLPKLMLHAETTPNRTGAAPS